MPQGSRSAKSIVDSAIRENERGLYILYGIAVGLVICGLCVLLIGVLKDNALTSIAGAVSSSLFLPAMTMAARFRRENIALRLLEAPLARADTSKEASEALYRYFVDISQQPPAQIPVQPQEEPTS
jgi:hypothetical protein